MFVKHHAEKLSRPHLYGIRGKRQMIIILFKKFNVYDFLYFLNNIGNFKK